MTVKPFLFLALAAALALVFAAHARPAQDFQQARLVEDSCTLPAYPEEAVHSGRSLRLRIDFTVGTDGRVKQAAVGQASGFPDYDRAVLDAIARCTYLPALRGGQPVEATMSREIVRKSRLPSRELP
jgi:D-alanyl-D-alanine endopeptidase (penicillin-binding protein 7)